MLTLSIKKGSTVYIGDSPLTVIQVSDDKVLCNFKRSTHIVIRNRFLKLDKDSTISYSRRKQSAAVLHFDSPFPIYRASVYDSRNLPGSN